MKNDIKKNKYPWSQKSMNIKEINMFFQKLQISALKKKLYFSFSRSQDLEHILNILQKQHYISGYTIYTSDNLVKIFLAYDIYGNCVIKEVKNVSSMKKRIIMNVKQIYFYLNDYPYSLVLLRTHCGILDIKTCLEKKIGGEVLICLK